MLLVRFINRNIFKIILVIELLCASNVKWGNDRWKRIIAYDGKGYYAYLPAIFIYHDLNFSFYDSIENKYSTKGTKYDIRVHAGNGIIDKYFAGTALAELPFFLLSHLAVNISGGPSDGYSFLYMLGISLAGIFYGLLGLFFLRKILRSWNFSENIITTILVSILFGTQLFYYSVFDPSISHVYSFALITAFIYFLKIYADRNRKKDLIISGFLLGWIILTRPVNGLIIFILPFIAGDSQSLIRTIKKVFSKKSGITYAILLLLFTLSIQGIIYFIQSGNFFNYSYTDESLIWNRPEIINLLLSYKKGLFIYTPITFIALTGLIPLYRKTAFASWSFIIFFLLISYVFSCWWSWWYGGSFSARPFTEYLSIFGILLAFSISSLKKRIHIIFANVILIFCIILCQVQTYQFRYNIIHWEKMDKEHYWRVFMRIDQLIKHENANADLLKEQDKN